MDYCRTEWMRKWLGVVAGAWLCCGPSGWGAGAEAETKTAKAPPSAEATAALGSFRLKPGFRIELVAAEPAVVAPVAMAFDENGRLFVAEMRDHPDRREATPHLGRIRLLEDTDGDGTYETSTLYAEDLPWPSALACYAGGVFVAATPEILYLKSSTGSGPADVRKVVFSGFGGTNKLTAQRLLNNFNWGLDNRIHAGGAGLGGVVSALGGLGGRPVALGERDFAFNPRTLELLPEAGSAQSGLSLDAWGRKYFCDWNRPLRTPMYEPRYAARNPFMPKAAEVLEVASPALPLFRSAPGQAPKPGGAGSLAGSGMGPETNYSAAVWMTQACGCVMYRGNAFPSNYLENVFIADSAAHVVHRAVLREAGLEVAATRSPDEQNTEFLVSKDNAFRPAQLLNGPDGGLYIADIQEGNDRGRIYRIVPANFKRPKPPELGKAKAYELVGALAQANGWHRETAARLLLERREAAAVPLLSDMLAKSRAPQARLQALHALAGMGALRETQVLQALGDTEERVREQAVVLAERFVTNGVISEPLWGRFQALAADPAVRVRYQVAFTLGELRHVGRTVALAGVLARNVTNPWVQTAVLSALSEGAGEFFVLLASDSGFRRDETGQDFLRQLAVMIGTKGRLDEVSQVLDFISQASLEPVQVFDWLFAVGDGLQRTRSSLGLVDPQGRLQPIYLRALDAAMNDATPEPVRLAAIRLLGLNPFSFTDTGDMLLLLCNARGYPRLQAAAINAMARYSDPRVVPELLTRWAALSPALRNQALAALLRRSERVPEVLAAVETGRIAPADFAAAQLNLLRSYPDPTISARAVRLFGPMPRQEPEAVQRWKPALRLRGMAERGRDLFMNRCAECHRFGREGQTLGPDLTGARIGGKEKLLAGILEPNAVMSPQYAACLLQTKEGESLLGIPGEETAVTITLRQPKGVQLVWPRLNAQFLQPQPWSLMPENLEQGMGLQDMADLLDYLMVGAR